MTKWGRIKYHPNLPLGENGKRVTACPEHIELSKNAAKEGMVLLKNKGGILPFAGGTLRPLITSRAAAEAVT